MFSQRPKKKQLFFYPTSKAHCKMKRVLWSLFPFICFFVYFCMLVFAHCPLTQFSYSRAYPAAPPKLSNNFQIQMSIKQPREMSIFCNIVKSLAWNFDHSIFELRLPLPPHISKNEVLATSLPLFSLFFTIRRNEMRHMFDTHTRW